jgi:uncharacterized protein
LRLRVKVVPGARRSRIAGWLGEALKVAVQAPRERGKANRAVTELLEDALGVAVRLVEGATSPWKTFEVPSLEEAELRRRVAEASRPATPP